MHKLSGKEDKISNYVLDHSSDMIKATAYVVW